MLAPAFRLDYSVAGTAAAMNRDEHAVRRLQPCAVIRLGTSTKRGMDMTSSPGNGWLDGVDMAAVVRGSSRGFTVLVLGGLAAPAAATVSGALGALILTGSAAAAFVVAALRQGTTTSGGLHGALAAVGAYLLVLPLVLLAQAGRDPAQISMTLAAAVVVGFVAGAAGTRRQLGHSESAGVRSAGERV